MVKSVVLSVLETVCEPRAPRQRVPGGNLTHGWSTWC